MLNQPARFLMEGLFPCLLLSSVLLPPLSASPGGKQGSTIVAHARHQIQITASARPTLALRHQVMASDRNSAICIWSNMPMTNYDVKVEADRAVAMSLPHSLREPVDFDCPTRSAGFSLLKKLENADDNVQMPSVVTLIIAPH
jgi:hypothetical protein